MTLRTSSATRRRVVSRSSVVLTTSATSNSKGATLIWKSDWVETESTATMIAAARKGAVVPSVSWEGRNCCGGRLSWPGGNPIPRLFLPPPVGRSRGKAGTPPADRRQWRLAPGSGTTDQSELLDVALGTYDRIQ